ncbi:hypothetical protein ADUPG1_010964 [Aduncisulcus paluster]|uniref:Nuclear speckle splicing regulatory protein 1 N-terminal domain-containing protein n=1 Tax=Aduncisulcus paluster TaxID=2918883 RepID=A0ABQ5JTL7_9EUKA|nr:hypothetical protein ADUPG1_010964 [Aduncisulcus paluster]
MSKSRGFDLSKFAGAVSTTSKDRKGNNSIIEKPFAQDYARPEIDEDLAYSKAPRRVAYKQYSLSDYKSLQQRTKTMRRGGLGADLERDSVIAARMKQERMKQYARAIGRRNKDIELQKRADKEEKEYEYDYEYEYEDEDDRDTDKEGKGYKSSKGTKKNAGKSALPSSKMTPEQAKLVLGRKPSKKGDVRSRKLAYAATIPKPHMNPIQPKSRDKKRDKLSHLQMMQKRHDEERQAVDIIAHELGLF